MSIKFPLLGAKDIEVKVKQVSAKGAVALLYKTARVDMALLDEVVGADKWENAYNDINGVLFCGIGVHTDSGVCWKWSNGIESRSDGDGNEKKGEASDAFKRAGFMWGIGRELYTAPFIFLSVETESDGNDGRKHKLKDRYATFSVKSITYDKDGTIEEVVIKNNKGEIVYPKNYTNSSKQQVEQNPLPPKPTTKSRSAQLVALVKGSSYTTEDVLRAILALGAKKADDLTQEQFDKLYSEIKEAVKHEPN